MTASEVRGPDHRRGGQPVRQGPRMGQVRVLRCRVLGLRRPVAQSISFNRGPKSTRSGDHRWWCGVLARNGTVSALFGQFEKSVVVIRQPMSDAHDAIGVGRALVGRIAEDLHERRSAHEGVHLFDEVVASSSCSATNSATSRLKRRRRLGSARYPSTRRTRRSSTAAHR